MYYLPPFPSFLFNGHYVAICVDDPNPLGISRRVNLRKQDH